jgi:ABC-2 type transport system permease protein
MSADVAAPRVARVGRYPTLVVASWTARRAVRTGALWGYVFGIVVATSSYGYASTYTTTAQRERLVTLFGSNTGLAAINGVGRELQTVAGYTVWKSAMFLYIVGAVWGLLTATKLTRGEEDAGRWELLLTGQTTRRRAAAQALAGLAAGLAVLWLLTAVITVAVGRLSKVQIAAGPGLYFALALVAPAAIFLAAGALASQLAGTRRQAAGYTGAALGMCYAVRMVADSDSTLGWLRWASPLGWVQQLQPLVDPRPLAMVPVVALVAALSGLTVHLADRRDLGASLLPDRTRARPRTRLLAGPVGLAIRLVRPTVLGWAAGIAVLALLMGFIAREGGDLLTSTASTEQVITRFGARGAGAELYLGFLSQVLAWMVAFVGAGQIAAARVEEAEGRLDHLLVRPVSRTSWLAGRLALAAIALAGCGLLAGLLAWAAAASENAGVRLTSMLGAGVNMLPPALCVLGIGIFAFGVWPRATTAAGYGVLTWSLFITLVGGFSTTNHWLLDTSVFHHMASAPAVSPDWTSAGALVGIGAVAALAGTLAFGRRDLAGE